MNPDGLTTQNIPLVCIYPVPGLRSRENVCVYDSMFEVAIYSNNGYSPVKATQLQVGTMVIGARVRTVLHQVQLDGVTMKVEFQSSYTYAPNVANISKYVLRFKVSEVIE